MFDEYDVLELFGPALRDSKIRRVVAVHEETTVILERGKRAIETARIDIHGDVRLARDVIAALPSTVRELHVKTPADLDRGALVALTAAARSLPALEVRQFRT
jgi:hypothetical protein